MNVGGGCLSKREGPDGLQKPHMSGSTTKSIYLQRIFRSRYPRALAQGFCGRSTHSSGYYPQLGNPQLGNSATATRHLVCFGHVVTIPYSPPG